MNLTESLTRFVEGNAVTMPTATPLQEAALGYSLATLSVIDSDEHLYRKITRSDAAAQAKAG